MTLYVEFQSIRDVSRFLAYARQKQCTVGNLELSRTKNQDGNTTVSAIVTLHFPELVSHTQIVEIYGALDGVTFIEEI